MDIKGELHFSPKYTFKQIEIALKGNEKSTLIDAFKDRICGFYLGPAQKLCQLNKFYAFAAGVLCVSTIDCLAMISISPNRVGDRFTQWTQNNIAELNQYNLASRFYDDFRNGLVHEGRIKNGAQFSYKYTKLVEMLKGAMVVNPDILLKKISKSFEDYIGKVERDDIEYKKLTDYLEKFDKELEYANSC
ncbi:MAG: hypothetical protein ABOK23_10970 [Candidatus Methanoperedens sp.]|nr:hypothetical protein [Candidatus Methanoperedens sp.]MCZ7395066.1 hypothetical protein [Candidatus Methanoperedens sp.]